MANPNIVQVANIYGKTSRSNLATTSEINILNNPSASNKLIKINTMNVSNGSNTNTSITIAFYEEDDLGGTSAHLVKDVTVPAYSTLTVIDKSTMYYLEENSSIGATAGTANVISIICSYEEIS